MKTLAEHNESRREAYKVADERMKPHPNGIECPECGKELWGSSPCMTLTGNPQQKNIHCPACGYVDYRLA